MNQVKNLPEDYSHDITDVIEAITLEHGDKPVLIGSGALKLNYPSDFDLMQKVPVSRHILSDLQIVVKKIMSMKGIYVGDIKSGICPDLQVVPRDLNSSNYASRRPAMLLRLKELHSNKNIDNDEYNSSVALLKPNLTEMDIYIIKHNIRFEVIRWSATDILKGFVIYRGHKLDFYKNLLLDDIENLTKIDIISWLNGVRYNEITLVYVFTKRGKPINSALSDFHALIISQMPYLLYKEKYMKIAKRINTLERMERTPNKPLLKKLYDLFNSDLARLNQVISDITAIQWLLENEENLPIERFHFEIDQFRYRLGNMTSVPYLKKQKVIYKMLKKLEGKITMPLLEKLHLKLLGILEPIVKRKLIRFKLLPVPSKYLPDNIHGNGNEIIMKKVDLLKEHKKLIPLLERGSLSERLKEAKDQQKEMKKYNS